MKFYASPDFQMLSLLNVVTHASGTAPTSPVDGTLWYDTSIHRLKFYDASVPAWTVIGSGLPANVSDGDKGDITVASGVWTIDPAAVSYAKIQNVTGLRLLGNDTGSPTSVREVLLAADHAFSGGALQLGAFTGDITKNAASLATTIANGAVNSAKIADGSVLVGDLDLTSVRLNTIGAPNGSVSLNSQNLTNVLDPVNPQDAATKAYADSVAAGMDPKGSVRAATTANITLSGTQTIDGVAVVVGDRVLVKNQTAPETNGIYVVASGAWTRTTDMDSWLEVPGAFTFTEEGGTQADTGWVCTSNRGGTLGTTAITWTQFSSPGSYIGGNGLTLTGLTFDVNTDNVGIEINADTLRLKDGGVTSAKIADGTIAAVDMGAGSVDLNSATVTNTLPVAKGGTGATTAAAARANLIAAGYYQFANAALTANVWSASIPHNLGTNRPHVQFFEVSSGENVNLDFKVVDPNNIQIRAGLAIAANAIGGYVVG